MSDGTSVPAARSPPGGARSALRLADSAWPREAHHLRRLHLQGSEMLARQELCGSGQEVDANIGTVCRLKIGQIKHTHHRRAHSLAAPQSIARCRPSTCRRSQWPARCHANIDQQRPVAVTSE